MVLNVARKLGLSRSPRIAPHQQSLLGRRRLVRNDPVNILREALSATAPTSVNSMIAAL
jgi:hypothetical protein